MRRSMDAITADATIDRMVNWYIRPHKFAYLLASDGDYEQARTVVEVSSRRWGGLRSIAAPFRQNAMDDEWRDTLRRFDPDIIWFLDSPSQKLADELVRDVLPLIIIGHPGGGAISPSLWKPLTDGGIAAGIPMHVYGPTWHLKTREWLPDTWLTIATVPDEDEALHDMMTAQVGAVGEALHPLWEQLQGEGRVWRADSLASLVANRNTSQLYHTQLYASRRTPWPSRERSVIFIVSEKPNIADFCLFWSLRGARGQDLDTYWTTPAWLSHKDVWSSLGAHDQQLHVDLISMSVSRPRLAGLSRRVPPEHEVKVPPSSDVLHVAQSALLSSDELPVRTDSLRGRTLSCQPPAPKFSSPTDYAGGSWVAVADIRGSRETADGIALPQVAGLADRCVELKPLGDKLFGEYHARIDRLGRIATSCSHRAAQIILSIPPDVEIAQHLLMRPSFAQRRACGTLGRPAKPELHKKAVLSNKGIGCEQLMSLLQRANHVLHLATPCAQELLDYTSRRSRSDSFRDSVRTVVEQQLTAQGVDPTDAAEVAGRCAGRICSRLPSIEEAAVSRRWVEENCQTSSKAAVLLLTTLRNIDVLRPGVLIGCDRCGTASRWIAAYELDDEIRCNLCGEVSRLPAELEWHYRLHPVVKRAYVDGQILPLLVRNHLAKEAVTGFIWVPELELYKSGTRTPTRDLDFFCCLDGEVTVGECSDPGDFSEADRDGLVHLAEELPVGRIIFATRQSRLSRRSSDIVDDTKAQVRAGTTVEVLTSNELLPRALR